MGKLLEYLFKAEPLALYGALTGTIGLLFGSIAAFNALYDRPWLRLKAYLQVVKFQKVEGRRVEVALFNSGRRKAVCYPPHLRVYDRTHRRFLSISPAEQWFDGHGWAEDPERSETHVATPLALAEYASELYLFNLQPDYVPLWAGVTDSLLRTTRAGIRFGRLRYLLCRIAVTVNPPKQPKRSKATAA